MTVLTDKPKVGQTDAALLAKELVEIYSTPTPKGWPEPKKVIDFVFDWLIIFTIAGVWYLYPKSKNEPYSSTTQYNLWHNENLPNLR